MRNRIALWRMYGKMYRAGKRTVRKMLRKGANPYLKMLRDLIDEDSRAECIELGTMDIPTNRIVGITAEEKQNKYLDLDQIPQPYKHQVCSIFRLKA